MGRTQIGELDEQIAMRAYPILHYFPIRDYSQEGIGNVIAGSAAIVRVARRACGIIAQDVRQQCPCYPPLM